MLTRRPLLWLALFALGHALAFAAVSEPPGRVRSPALPADSLRVWVLGSGYHAAILVEQPPGARLGPPGQEGAPVVEFAWGDRRFFMDGAHHWLPLTLFWPTESVVYVEARRGPPERPERFRVFETRRVSPAEWQALARSLERSFVRTPGGARAAPHPPHDVFPGRFYPGRRPYSLAYTCNTWVVARLAEAGLTRPGGPVVLVDQIRPRLRGFERVR